jgi:hypothetical protein
MGRLLSGLFSKDWKGFVAIIVVLTFLMVALSAAIAPQQTSHLLAYDNDWDDLSKFRGDILGMPLNLSVRTVDSSAASLIDILDARGMLYMAIGVERSYTFAEWRAIQYFLSRGGTVIIADDYGFGNSLLRYNNYLDNPAVSHIFDTPDVQYLFSGETLADVRVDRNPLLVRVTVPIWAGLEYEILLNDPSCFVLNDNWDDPGPRDRGQAERVDPVIATSSAYGWIDENRNGARDPGEKAGVYPIIIEQEGMLLISDPSIFINDMYERMDNRRFAQALITRMVTVNGMVIFDESIHLESGLLAEVDDTIIRPLYRVFGESWPVNAFFLILVVGIGGMIAVSRKLQPRYLPHMNRLREPRTLEFGLPYNWLADYYDVRGVLLQRMRYAYGLDPTDLQRLPPELVAQLLGDQYLVQFVLHPIRVDPIALNAAVGDIATWEPPINADLVVTRAEAYLASLPPDVPDAWSGQPVQPTYITGGGRR